MNKIEELIEQLCPEGVDWKEIGEIAEVFTGGEAPSNGIKGEISNDQYRYPIYANGSEIYGFTDTYKIDKDAVTISSIGANTGAIYFRKAFFTPIIRLKVILPESDIMLSRFLFHYLCSIKISSKKSSVPNLNANDVKKITIPIPPLAIQHEIVHILDLFTQLEAELEAELEARKTQYTFYRDALLNFEGKEVEWKTLGEVCILKAGKAVSAYEISSIKNPEHLYPCIGGNGLRGYVKSFSNTGDYPIIGRQGALCGNIFFARDKFYATEHAVIVSSGKSLIPRFLYYLLITLNLNQYATGGAQPGLAVSKLVQIKIPIPSLSEQARIVSILDKFDALVNDISSGLPAEIQARRQQYEYYRNQLLTFKNKAHG